MALTLAIGAAGSVSAHHALSSDCDTITFASTNEGWAASVWPYGSSKGETEVIYGPFPDDGDFTYPIAAGTYNWRFYDDRDDSRESGTVTVDACQEPTPTPEVTPSWSPTPTATATPVVTPTPTPSPSIATPTPTTPPSEEPTVEPTPEPSTPTATPTPPATSPPSSPTATPTIPPSSSATRTPDLPQTSTIDTPPSSGSPALIAVVLALTALGGGLLAKARQMGRVG